MIHALSSRALYVFVVLFAASALAGCSADPFAPDRDRLGENRELWRSHGLASYSFVYRAQCFCLPDARGPFTVRIIDGEVASITVVETGEPGDPAMFGDELTVEGLYRSLEDALAEDPATFSAEYDESLGYPTSAFVDFDERVADEENGFSIEELHSVRE